MKRLEKKVAVITGGNSGMGLAAAKLFAQEGARVAITGRSHATIKDAISEIGNDAIGFVSDVSDLSNIDTLYKNVIEVFGKIDVLVVNAGVAADGPLADYTEAQFDTTSDVNFKGAFFTVQRALPYLNDGASIILTGSTISEKGFATTAVYAATKAAIRSLARSFSAELLDRQIRVNVLSPGPVDTPIFERNGNTKEQANAKKDFFASAIPAKRMGTSEEIAAGFLYLASDDSRFMLGAELLLDGGFRSL